MELFHKTVGFSASFEKLRDLEALGLHTHMAAISSVWAVAILSNLL